MRSPPLLVSFSLSQHTTVVCGGGGLNKYQPRGADGPQRRLFELFPAFSPVGRSSPGPFGFHPEKARQGQSWALTITSTSFGMFLYPRLGACVGESHMDLCTTKGPASRP